MTDITLLDGSIGQELVKRTDDRATPLWSTQVMIDHPHLVGEVHAVYFAVGATVATTNTYAVMADRLQRVNLTDRLPQLLETALSAAQTARDAHGSGRIAGSLGPIGASYRPDIHVTKEDAATAYDPALAMLDAHIDLWLIETMSSLNHATSTLAAVKDASTKPVWLAVSVDDFDGTKLRSGEPIQTITDLILSLPDDRKPDAILINCSRPEVVADGLAILTHAGIPFGAYANGFTKISEGFLKDAPTVDALEQRVDLTPDTYANHAMGWVAQGATIVGGCCEVGPDHIAELARRLKIDGHHLV
ncbi:homocysteine S-methyltransferase family protein [Aestuariivita boseongensis]|uniref:homocysteine S-methyltransferase family protein n=1 Tax=Aestuariivita boseongensis TaxID=1470562 RepID=UPI00068349A4|nr:homocysteine S-methyltransferase family protein [Aestuariivita boseongensis]